MMLMAFIGGSSELQKSAVDELASELRGFKVQLINNNSEHADADLKYRRINRVVLGRARRDTVTIITGVDTQAEYDLLKRNRAVFCIMSSYLPPLFNSNAIDGSCLFVSRFPERKTTEAKRRMYLTPTEAFSECYRREREATVGNREAKDE